LEETDRFKYGLGNDDSCENCIAHCGYEPTAVLRTTGSINESLRAAFETKYSGDSVARSRRLL
jgi:hypothetical protein